ncbi:hypothetical protein NKG94_45410 [Micromonospora sp. M12]
MATDAGAGSVGADEHIGGGRAAIGEARGDGSVAVLLVADELLVESDRVVKIGEEYPAQGDAADRVLVGGHRVLRFGPDAHQQAQVFVVHAHAGARVAGRVCQFAPQFRGEALGQRGTAVGFDVDAVS